MDIPSLPRAEDARRLFGDLSEKGKSLIRGNSSPPPIKTGRSTEKSLTPGDIPSLIGDYSARSLEQNGISARELLWVIPITSVQLRSGGAYDNGFCAGTPDGRILVFRYSDADGFRFSTTRPEESNPGIDQEGRVPVLTLSFEGSGPIQHLRSRITDGFINSSTGDWITLWRPVITQAIGAPSALVNLITIERHGIEENRFGSRRVGAERELFCAMVNGLPVFFPEDQFPLGAAKKWDSTPDSISIMLEEDFRPIVISIRGRSSSPGSDCLKDLKVTLEQQGTQPSNDLLGELATLGDFKVQFPGSTTPERRAIKKEPDTIKILEGLENEPSSYQYGFAFRDSAVLIGGQDRWARVLLVNAEAVELVTSLMGPEKMDFHEGGLLSTIVLRDDGETPVRLTVSDSHITVGEDQHILLEDGAKLDVEPFEKGFCYIRMSFETHDGGTHSTVLIAPEQLAFRIWEEWDVRRTKAGIANAGSVHLYKKFIESKKYSLLYALFSDIVLLNRELNKQVSMEEIRKELESMGGEEFSKDKKLRELTINKMGLLTTALPQIKQRFELLATMYPYYWAQQDASWLESVFGKSRSAGTVVMETQRMVPVVRREVRTIQGNLLRPLSEIESSIRPLEALFARQEIQNSGAGKLRRFVPMAVKGAAALAMVIHPVGAAYMMINTVGGFLAGDVAGSWANMITQNQETDAQFRRAAEAVIPWWQIFIRALTVTIYETSQFIDGENNRTMKRDRGAV